MVPEDRCAALTKFADYVIKPYIPRLWHNFLDFLTVECKSDELRSQPRLSAAQESKRAIEIAAAHTDAIASMIKSDEWCYDDVEFQRLDL